MDVNMFAPLDGLNDEVFFAPADAVANVIAEHLAGEGSQKAQPILRAPRDVVTYVPQTARPPIVAPEYVNTTEVLFPPKAIRTLRDAKKGAAMRLGVMFGSAVIIYG